jgi:hypothetical protein
MTADDHLLQRVREVLAGEPGIEEKRMVGGRSFLSNGRMCCGVTSGGLMVRIGTAEMAAVLSKPNVTAMTLGGRTLAAFVVEPAGVRTDADLARWVRQGVISTTHT